ncbi:Hpt domain-containing protein [Acinetobacter sp. ANC5681]|uniref:hybrid sensor histidine kinase/response regulator n=1 Tax=Acinetobacter sp. ANC5681 TaxID=2929504 RepID=UPI00201A4C0B|nr:Hpt domain-containing protein [Acinetobacter sp. ANC5681]MCL5768294.1 Hpt domain-containing protein [Acinetobacter sp. ANC5681]
MKEILKTLVETMTLPEDSYLEQDAEILEIFIEELDEIFVELEPLIGQWIEQPNQQDVLTDIRRHFHTLKGSGRMVGAKSSGELAWTVEDTLNRVLAGTVLLNSDIQHYVKAVFNIYRFKLVHDFKLVQKHQIDLKPLVLLGQQLQQQLSIEPALAELLQLSNMLNDNAETGLELISVNVDTVVEEKTVDVADSESVFIGHPLDDEALIKETLSIFLEEAEDHLTTIDQFLLNDRPTNDNYNTLIRALHTLRGSSAMAHVEHVFEASSKVENLFKTLLQEELDSSSDETALLTHYAQFVRDYLHTLKHQGSQQKFEEIYNTFNVAWDSYDFQLEEKQGESLRPQGLVSQLLELNINDLLDVEFDFEKRARTEFPQYIQLLSQQTETLLEHTHHHATIGMYQYTSLLRSSYQDLLFKPDLLNLDYAFELYYQVHQQFIQLFDTLAAGQRVTLTKVHELVLNELSSFTQQNIEFLEAPVTEQKAGLVEAPIAEFEPSSNKVDVSVLAAQFALDKQSLQSSDSNRDFDPDLLDIFLEEADELLVGIDADLNTWTADQQNVGALKNLMRYLHTLKGGSNMIQAGHIGLIAHELETIYEKLINQQLQPNPQLIAVIRAVQDDIADRIQTVRDKQVDYPATHVLQLLQQANQSIDFTSSSPVTFEPVAENHVAAVIETDDLTDLSIDEFSLVEAQEVLEDTSNAEIVHEVALDDDVRSLVEQTFLEEAEELLEQAKGLLRQWFDQRGNRSLLLQLQRNAHSLKGGARMAELDAIAIVAYHLENAFEQFGVHHFNSNVYDNLLNTALAWLSDAISKRQYANFDGLKQSLENMEFVDVSAQLPQKLSAKDIFTPEYTMEFVQGDGTEPPSMLGEWETTERIEQNNEMIRVSADVIEKMIDLSGENAINRSRIEMDLGQLGGTLTEMELAIKRLADQLRRMEGELESQIIARHGGENSRYADFDPLEMDQYSSLNQLSKSLAESASDLVDFKTTLSEKIRDTEGLLLQQSRIQAEIQESLMRTRLVPFSRLLPRLQRIVRQTASTLNRPTELIVNNTEGELDRSILEKLVAPFEHMLRNAIDHGIEDREQRLQAKKPETGHIALDIGRQGTDIVVTFSDDGKGIDVNRIKDKAIQTGLMTKEQKLDHEEILQFIFHPGFSTAAQVTQISGRGVGLDVVQSDIKALGGHVSVNSVLGKGTTFTIRVPTTVAVSDALMVKAGDQQFAFPLAQIDRIVRISPAALEQYFESKDDYFKIDQESYRLRYLSEFVAGQPIPRLNGVVHSLPVLLVKGAQGQTTALLVDQLIGSRGQIVVKPIGQQFSSIGVIAGATIMGDGQVCLILDGQNIARQAQSTARSKQADETYTKQRYDERRLIMIVDDSVTVRKVTSRLLERQGYDVVTAKDGVDAIEQLETIKPDLMLLDIEMPRMDGFEVTNLVRHHELHRDLPIIMITSRTGEKHRERALSLGVNQYMGKPFQEETLLENIESLLTVRS